MRASLRVLFALVLLFTLGQAALAKDLFVKAGSSGDGSREKPFGDPYEALDKCEANDAIHIAEGKYYGKLGKGEWEIPYEGIQLIGGYTGDFSQRDPWVHQTLLSWDRNSKNSPTAERIIARQKGAVLDGLVLDGFEQNQYSGAGQGREPRDLDKADALVRMWLPSTVKNCIFINTPKEGVVCANGTTIENNLFVNVFDTAVKINGLPAADPQSRVPSVIKNNTFVWSWDDRAPGQGRYTGTAIEMSGPVTITNNILAFSDNDAIYGTIDLDRSSITNNLFFMNQFANLKAGTAGKDVVVDDKHMDLLEEAGLKAFEGNTVGDPGLALDKGWMESTTKRTASEQSKVTMDDWNKVRQSLGMDLQGTGGRDATGIAPAYPLEKAVALMTPKNAKAGARMVKLEVKFAGPVAEGPAKNYEKKELTAWAGDPESVDGKPLEMVVAISNVANIGGIPSQFKPDDYEGIYLHDANGDARVTGFYKKGSTVNRVVTDGAGEYNGSGKASKLYRVTGTAYVVKNIPKAGFQIDSISPLDASDMGKKRAVGRDWFVKAGASGGDGSKDKPFRDPYQALEKVEAGDFIHVAGGEYVGKLRAGTWTISMPDVTMLGGYSADFTARDPWKNPTVLYCPEDYKGSRGGYTFQGDQDHTNFVLDGFVFDKKLNNKYQTTGDLMPEESDKTPHLWLSRPGCVVRNCVFMNGAEGAVRMTASQTIENCIFLNHYKYAVDIEGGFTPEVPLHFLHNTVAFAWEERFGKGHGITADLLMLHTNVHAIVDSNIFEFADNHAIRLDTDPKNVELTNNVFAHNLFAEVFQAKDENFVDNLNFDKLGQLGWKKCEGNVLAIPGLPLDAKWFDVYLNRTAYVEGKVKMDDWNQMREVLGEPPIATGGKAAAGMAPAYDRAKAMALFPKNSQVKAGARPQTLEVKFTGIARADAPSVDYQEVTWDDARNADAWDKLKGKHVTFKGAIQRDDNTYNLDDIKKEGYVVYMVGGPEGSNSPGLPMRVYVPKGTKMERTFQQAKGYSTGTVEETHVFKGIARENRQMVIEAVEKGD